jgi:DEAD/DEAH box helicase domain-containing protein
MDVSDLLGFWREDPSLRENLRHTFDLPARQAAFAPFPAWLDPRLAAALTARGVAQLYTHQAAAVDAFRAGENVLLATPTASGKTLVYNLPVLQRLVEDPHARALYLFPPKALAADQYAELKELSEAAGLPAKTHTFDGDTPQDARTAIREHGNVVISNPDMLHAGVLPHHTKWARFFSNLQVIVVDEIHTYRGVFGSHFTNVIRRLKRVCAHYGASPRWILCSATIANPAEHAERLIEEPVTLFDRSGAPSGERHVVFYNPPVVNVALNLRRSYLLETVRLVSTPIANGLPSIVFTSSRLNVEVLLRYLRAELAKQHLDPELVQGYRGGYLPSKRRAIEQGLRTGKVLGVVATNALELGIDIGHLDVAFVVGYPGSVASFLQQSGRAGRSKRDSLTVYIGRSSPIDQYLMEHPELIIDRAPERARTNPDNVFIAAEHVKCAAFELPFQRDEPLGRFGAKNTTGVLDYLARHRVVNPRDGVFYWSDRAFPANQVGLRAIPGENFTVLDRKHDNQVIAEVDYEGAFSQLHENAIYTVDGQPFQVKQLDFEGHRAYVEPAEVDYYTDAMEYSEVKVLAEDERREAGPVTLSKGDVKVTRKVIGFKKIKLYTNENLGYGEVVLPERNVHTMACWFTVPRALQDHLRQGPAELVDAVLGASHALLHLAAVLLMCDVRDLGRAVGDPSGETFVRLSGKNPELPPDFEPTVYLYDVYPGGIGLGDELFERHAELVQRSLSHLQSCACEHGCPSCIGPFQLYYAGMKGNAVALLRALEA